jgi:hypothetical protein
MLLNETEEGREEKEEDIGSHWMTLWKTENTEN